MHYFRGILQASHGRRRSPQFLVHPFGRTGGSRWLCGGHMAGGALVQLGQMKMEMIHDDLDDLTGGHLYGNWLLDGRVLWLAQPLPERWQ